MTDDARAIQGVITKDEALKVREKWDRRLWSVLNHVGAVEPYITRKEAQEWMADLDRLLSALAGEAQPEISRLNAERAFVYRVRARAIGLQRKYRLSSAAATQEAFETEAGLQLAELRQDQRAHNGSD